MDGPAVRYWWISNKGIVSDIMEKITRRSFMKALGLATAMPAAMLKTKAKPEEVVYSISEFIAKVLYAGEDIHFDNFLFIGDDNKVYNANLTPKPIIAHNLGKANQYFEAVYEVDIE